MVERHGEVVLGVAILSDNWSSQSKTCNDFVDETFHDPTQTIDLAYCHCNVYLLELSKKQERAAMLGGQRGPSMSGAETVDKVTWKLAEHTSCS